MPTKGNALMPACNAKDQAKILAAIATLRGEGRASAMVLCESIGAKALTTVLHAMRRWYSAQGWSSASKLLQWRAELGSGAMQLHAPVGAYRGFKVPKSSPLAQLKEGDEFELHVHLNGGCSSWTLQRTFAHRFSGRSSEKTGLIVQLADADRAHAFIAPPSRSASWWNALYEKTMSRSFRFNEQEFGVFGRTLTARVVEVKR